MQTGYILLPMCQYTVCESSVLDTNLCGLLGVVPGTCAGVRLRGVGTDYVGDIVLDEENMKWTHYVELSPW